MERSEECDPGWDKDSDPCCQNNCGLRRGAQCSFRHSPCCTPNCTIAPPTQRCYPEGENLYNSVVIAIFYLYIYIYIYYKSICPLSNIQILTPVKFLINFKNIFLKKSTRNKLLLSKIWFTNIHRKG